MEHYLRSQLSIDERLQAQVEAKKQVHLQGQNVSAHGDEPTPIASPSDAAAQDIDGASFPSYILQTLQEKRQQRTFESYGGSSVEEELVQRLEQRDENPVARAEQ